MFRRTLLGLGAVAALCASTLFAPPSSGAPGERMRGVAGGTHIGHAIVADITDGDTIEVTFKGRTENVRLIGIDTPEVYFGVECGDTQASASIKHILQVGDRVKLVRDRSQDNRDHYGRLLRYVSTPAATSVGAKSARAGPRSTSSRRRSSASVPIRRVRRAAHRSNRGVWQLCHGNFDQSL